MTTNFKGKTALITGASSGIGADIARVLAEEGARLVLVARRRDRLDALKKELAPQTDSMTDSIEVIDMDLGSREGVGHLVRLVEALPRPIDILVNNAGFGISGPIHESDSERIQEMCELNMMTVTRLSQWAARQMVKRGSGYILNVASTAAFQPIPYLAAYAATKAYVSSLSIGMNRELAGLGVVVSCLHPGKTETEFFDVAQVKSDRFAKRISAMRSIDVARIGVEGLRAGKSMTIAGLGNQLLYHLGKPAPLSIKLQVTERLLGLHPRAKA